MNPGSAIGDPGDVGTQAPNLKRQRYNRILALSISLVAAATSGAAQSATWRCDDGRPCVLSATSCCPPERVAGRCGAGMSCCAALAENRAAASAAPACCATAPRGAAPAASAPLTSQLAVTRGLPCRCEAAYAARPVAVKQRL